jgi:hypothetical protein
MKPTLRKLTAELHQVNTHVKVQLQGSGPLQQELEKVESGAFGIMMSGVKCDVIELVHGEFRRQLMGFYVQNGGGKEEYSEVEVASVMADSNIRFDVNVQLTFAREIPDEMRQNAASTLTAACLQFASASVSRARLNLAMANAQHGAELPYGMTPGIDLPPEALRQIVAQQVHQGDTSPVTIMTRASGTDTSSQSPGQYL